MKSSARKIIAVCAAFFIVASACAEDLRVPHRLFEVGISPSFGISNNTFAALEFFQKNLVIDLRKISEQMSDAGFSLNENIDVRALFVNLNLPNGLQIGFEAGAESTGIFNVGKSLFTAIGEGFDSNISANLQSSFDAFAYAAFSGSYKLENEIRISVMPTLVAPLFYARAKDVVANFYSQKDGKIGAEIGGQLDLFSSIVDVSGILSGNQNGVAFGAGGGLGFELGLAVEMPFFLYKKLQLGAYARIPIVPGTLNYGAGGSIDWKYEFDLASVFSENTETPDDIKFSTSASTAANFKISRPLRFGVEAAFRPFGSWFDMFASLGLGMRYPYSGDIVVYPEYALGVSVNAANTVGVTFSSIYMKQIFIHELNFMLNAHVFELNFAVSMQSGNFFKSFQGAGLGAKLYIAFGVPIFSKKN